MQIEYEHARENRHRVDTEAHETESESKGRQDVERYAKDLARHQEMRVVLCRVLVASLYIPLNKIDASDLSNHSRGSTLLLTPSVRPGTAKTTAALLDRRSIVSHDESLRLERRVKRTE